MNWPMVKLGDCCTVVGGATPKREIAEYWSSPDVPWVTPKDVSKLKTPILDDAPEYISELGLKSCSASMLPKGSVLLTSRAPIGNVAIAGRDMCTNQGFKSLIPSDSVDGTYLYYCMLAHSEKLQALGNGATFKEVSKKIVEDFQIPLPPLAEQKRIAAILDKADAIRRKRQQAIQLADDFLRAVFLEMFGDPAINPRGWNKVTLDSIALRVTDGEHQTPKREENGFMLLSARNIQHGYIDITNEKVDYIGEDEYRRITKRLNVELGDLLVSCSGSIGRVALNTLSQSFCLVRSVAVIKVNRSVMSSIYLMCYLQTEYLQRVMDKEANSSSQKNLFQNQIKNLNVLVPPKELQDKFASIYLQHAQSTNKLASLIEQSDEIFKSLSQRSFACKL